MRIPAKSSFDLIRHLLYFGLAVRGQSTALRAPEDRAPSRVQGLIADLAIIAVEGCAV
jgi:hypothetical protein